LDAFQETLEFDKRRAIPISARGPLSLNKPGKTERCDLARKHFHVDRVLLNCIIIAQTGDLGEQVDFTDIGLKREIVELRRVASSQQKGGRQENL
jgi:hypothetical protein